MATFKYKINKNGEIITDIIRATDLNEARRLIDIGNVEVISVSRQNPLIAFLSDTRLTNKEMIGFFSSISAMDRVGIDILHAMQMMKDDIAPTANLKKVCALIYNKIVSGSPFSVACQNSSNSFTEDFVGLIAIAERTGKFHLVFDEIVGYLKWIYDIQHDAKRAITGPLFTLLLMLAMIIVMSIFALPKIMDFLQYFNMTPPIYTVALIVFAGFIKNYWLAIIGVIVVTPVVSIIFGSVFRPLAIGIDRCKLSIPLFGDLLLKIDTSRFLAFFTLMYNSGADMVEIIKNLSKVLKNKYLSSRVEIIYQQVLDGKTFFKAIDQETMFPKMFRKMMSICEITGEVGSVLTNIKYFYDKETKDTVERIVGTIKPVMTIVLGGILIWMGGAMLGPIYSNIGNLGGDSSNNAKGKSGESSD